MSKSCTHIPMTPGQQAMLAGQLLARESTLYNMIMTFKIEAEIDEYAFGLAFDELVNDFDAMRITIQDLESAPQQVIYSEINYGLDFVDFSNSNDPQVEVDKWLETRKRKRLDLSVCLFDSALIKLHKKYYLWYFNQHHLATDGWSLKLAFDYISSAYVKHINGDASEKTLNFTGLQSSPNSFSDYAHSIYKLLNDSSDRATRNRKGSQDYWQQRLDKPYTPNTFYRAFGRKTSAFQKGLSTPYQSKRYVCSFGQSRSHQFRIRSISEEFAAFSADLGQMQLFATVIIACLFRLNGGSRQALGTPYHSRVKRNHKNTPGAFINLFPLHVEIENGETFVSLYEKLARANQGLLLNSLPGACKVPKENSFDVLFNFINARFGQFVGHPTKTDFLHGGESDSDHRLRILVHDFDNTGTFSVLVDANDEFFSPSEANDFCTHFLAITDALLADPHQQVSKPALLPAPSAQSINNDTRINKHKYSVLQYIEEDSLNKQHHIALYQKGKDGQAKSVTFAELSRISDVLAQFVIVQDEQTHQAGCLLKHNQQTPLPPIAIFMPRSIDAVISILAVLKTGQAFIPIDISYPIEKVKMILDDAKVITVISNSACRSVVTSLPQKILYVDQLDFEQELTTNEAKLSLFNEAIRPEDTAYVLYTSGSTGQPKGVEITHEALTNYLSWAKDYYTKGEPLDFALFTSLSFDLSMTSLFLPLMLGSRLIIYPQEFDSSDPTNVATSGLSLREVIQDNQAHVIKLTPSHLALIQDIDLSRHALQKVIVGGEDFQFETAFALYHATKGNIKIFNEYGPTEATVACSVYEFKPEDFSSSAMHSLPIGQPIDNCQIYILDQHMNAVPQGVIGELYIAGRGLARGYLHNPKINEERFVEIVIDAQSNKAIRVYKSGDLACYDSDGTIHYFGRSDRQIKLRGVRLEIGEIESVLLSMPEINEAVVELVNSETHPQLIAFYTLKKDVIQHEIVDHLARKLSANAIPQKLIALDEMPLNNNGKIERTTLIEIAKAHSTDSKNKQAIASEEMEKARPLNAIELRLFDIWKRFLKIETFSVTDNFFNLGGDSLITIQVVVAAKEQGIDITPQQVFACPTIEGLASVANTEKKIAATQEEVTGAMPMLAIQKHYLENDSSENHQFVQSVTLEYERHLSQETLNLAFERLMAHHDGLRTQFTKTQDGWQPYVSAHKECISQSYQKANDENLKQVFTKQRAELISKLDIEKGILLAYSHISDGDKTKLLIVVHHLVMDGISWWLLLSDLEKCLSQAQANSIMHLPLKTSSVKQWSDALLDYANGKETEPARRYWLQQYTAADYEHLPELSYQQDEVTIVLNKKTSEQLLRWSSESNENSIPQFLLCAIYRCKDWFKQHKLLSSNNEFLIDLEGHGRESIIKGMDITRTIGWFTSVYPLALQSTSELPSLEYIKAQVQSIPNNGIDYGLLKCFSERPEVQTVLMTHPKPLLLFNYLSEWERNLDSGSQFTFIEALSSHHAEAVRLEYAIEFNSMFFAEQLQVTISYDAMLFNEASMAGFCEHLNKHIDVAIHEHCVEAMPTGSNGQFSSANLNDSDLADVLSEFSE